MLGWIGMGVGALIGIGRAIGNHKAKQAKYDSAIQDTADKITQATTAKDNLQTEYDLTKAHTEANIATIGQNRDTTLKPQATIAISEDRANIDALASLKVDNAQAVGQASAIQSNSGFRRTGTGAAAVNDVTDKARRNFAQASARKDLTQYQSYSQAVNSYINANQQIDQQNQNLEQAALNKKNQETLLELQLSQLQREHAQLTTDRNKFDWWGSLADIGSSSLSGYSSMRE